MAASSAALTLDRVEFTENTRTYQGKPYVVALVVAPDTGNTAPTFRVEEWEESSPREILSRETADGLAFATVHVALMDSTDGAERAGQRLDDLREVLVNGTRLGQMARHGNPIGSIGLAHSLGTEALSLAIQLLRRGGDALVSRVDPKLPREGKALVIPKRVVGASVGAVFHFGGSGSKAVETKPDPELAPLGGTVSEIEEHVLTVDDPDVLDRLLKAEEAAKNPRKGALEAIGARLDDVLSEPERTPEVAEPVSEGDEAE